MKDTIIDAPKMFREMHEIDIENVLMNDADEVFWKCNEISVKNLKLHGGTYPFMLCRNLRIDGLESDSKYISSMSRIWSFAMHGSPLKTPCGNARM